MPLDLDMIHYLIRRHKAEGTPLILWVVPHNIKGSILPKNFPFPITSDFEVSTGGFNGKSTKSVNDFSTDTLWAVEYDRMQTFQDYWEAWGMLERIKNQEGET